MAGGRAIAPTKIDECQPYNSQLPDRMDGDDEAVGAMDEQEDVLGALNDLDAGEREEAAAAAASSDPLASLLKHHPECILDYTEEIAAKLPLTAGIPGEMDPNHTSPPFLTQYEKTIILGKRANQLSQQARPYINVPEYVTDVTEIARMELEQKRLPFIVKRPMPDGTFEYWRLSDLMIL